MTARGVCWSTSQNPTISGNHTTDGTGTGSFTSSISGLSPNTTYYVRAYATNSVGTAYGEQRSFTTSCNTVTVSISGTTNINYGGSTTLTASGASSYRWSTGATTAAITVSPTTTTTYTVTGTDTYGCTGTRSVTVTVNGTVPTVSTNTVTNIAATSASCGGNVTSNGGANVTARGVCWSTSQNPTISDSHTTDGSGTESFTSSISGLSPNTTYYVRAYATNSVGTAYGNEVSFTTECTEWTLAIFGDSVITRGDSVTLHAVAPGAVPPVAVGDILCTDNTTVKPDQLAASGKTPMGVVFFVDNTGLHGWAVNLTETTARWSNEQVDIPDLPNFTSSRAALTDTAGYSNTRAIRAFGDAATYPAAWAVDFDHGWYLPTAGQLRTLYDEAPNLNAPLQAAGGTQVSIGPHWSSTERYRISAYYVLYNGHVDYSTNKNNEYIVRSVRSF